MTDEQIRADFEAHINGCVVSENLFRALEVDSMGDYLTTWVQGKWQSWQAATLKANQWRPIADALEGEHCVCCWLDKDDGDIRHNFDWLEDGVWQNYFNEHEHLLIAGAASGCSEDAPYTHFMTLPLPPTGTE